MLIEALIFNGDNCVLKVLGDIRQPDKVPVRFRKCQLLDPLPLLVADISGCLRRSKRHRRDIRSTPDNPRYLCKYIDPRSDHDDQDCKKSDLQD